MITITITGADGLQRTFEGTAAQIRRAGTRANQRTADKFAGDASKAMANSSGLKRSLLAKYRTFASKSRDGVSVNVWLGFNQVKASYAGRLRQEDWGAAADKFFFPGSFVARMRSGHVGIFSRRGRSRLPIDEQGINLMATVPRVPPLLAGLDAYWAKRFAEELNFQTNVKGGE
jgi:hypothetical protein